MPDHFLGKSLPRAKAARPLPRPRRFSWTLHVLAPVALIGSAAFLWIVVAVPTSTSNISSPPSRILGSVTTQVVTLAAVPSPTGPLCYSDPDKALTKLMDEYPARNVFPLIPPVLLSPVTNSTDSTSTGTTSTDPAYCPPPYWNLNIFRYLAYKVLALLQWLATALAVILTVYAGLLYISGFASENNVKKAKTILVAAYTGLIIVMLARIIFYGTLQTAIGRAYNPDVNPLDKNFSNGS